MNRLTLEAELSRAKREMQQAAPGNIVENCQHYLRLLDQYRDELFKFRTAPEIKRHQASTAGLEVINATRKEIRTAIERTTSERNETQALLKSLTAISGYEAIETLNHSQYKGFSDWVLKAGGARAGGAEVAQMSVQAAVEAASLLRRQEYLTQQKTSLGNQKK